MNCSIAVRILLMVFSVSSLSSAISIDLAKLKALKSANMTSGSNGDTDIYTEQMYRMLAGEKTGEEYMAPISGSGQSFSEIDRCIDEKTYILGSNDELSIYIWGSLNETLRGVIDNEGTLVIPSVGTISLGGVTLIEAKEKIKQSIKNTYKDADVTIVLSRVRKFRAYILGEVRHPGGFIINGATRVSDLIDLSGGIVRQDSCRMRAVEIVNEGRNTRYADMVLFYQNNDIRGNPYLSEGDRVFLRRRKDIVSISGDVTYPGTYDFVEGDSTITLIRAAGGFTRNADSTRIVLARFSQNGTIESTTLDYSGLCSTLLQKDDRILVSRQPEYRIHRNVVVTGEVLYPGRYPITPNSTRLRTVIEMAGGFTDEALLGQSSLYRKRRYMKRDDEFEVLEGVPFGSLSPIEKGFIRAKYMGKDGMFSIDFDKLFKKDREIYDITLLDGDSIVISRKNLSVEVSGAVVMPGLVTFDEKADIKDYIEKAGGYNKRAKRLQTVVIRGNSGVWLRGSDVDNIREGDIILVPEREYKEFTKVARDVLVILSSIAAVITAYIAVSNSLNN
jgi:protein involved in polysaccharide export with SLBB domain